MTYLLYVLGMVAFVRMLYFEDNSPINGIQETILVFLFTVGWPLVMFVITIVEVRAFIARNWHGWR